MMYKTLPILALLLALTACGSLGKARDFDKEEWAKQARHEQIVADAPHPNFIGTPEWYAWVNRWTGVVDAQGHGPDSGSTEWCHAVNFQVTGFRPDETLVCDKTWERRIDSYLRSDHGLLDIFR